MWVELGLKCCANPKCLSSCSSCSVFVTTRWALVECLWWKFFFFFLNCCIEYFYTIKIIIMHSSKLLMFLKKNLKVVLVILIRGMYAWCRPWCTSFMQCKACLLHTGPTVLAWLWTHAGDSTKPPLFHGCYQLGKKKIWEINKEIW